MGVIITEKQYVNITKDGSIIMEKENLFEKIMSIIGVYDTMMMIDSDYIINNEKFDELRLRRIRFLEKRLKKNGLSIYVNDAGDVE